MRTVIDIFGGGQVLGPFANGLFVMCCPWQEHDDKSVPAFVVLSWWLWGRVSAAGVDSILSRMRSDMRLIEGLSRVVNQPLLRPRLPLPASAPSPPQSIVWQMLNGIACWPHHCKLNGGVHVSFTLIVISCGITLTPLRLSTLTSVD